MQYQPPQRNNPANPLFKVAALSLEKVYEAVKPIAQARVKASLNFKRSSDLRGIAKSPSGDDITVCFTLSIRRASLEIRFSFEGGSSDGIKIQDVAYAAPFEKKRKVVTRDTLDKNSKSVFQIGGALKARFGLGHSSGAASTKASVDKSASGAQKSNATITSSYDNNNISVTFAGNIIHWEFSSEDKFTTPHQIARPTYLEGEVFYSAKQADLIDACVVSWPQSVENTLLVAGLVFTSMQDLDIDQVTFLTSDGEVADLGDLDQSQFVNSQGFSVFLETNENKKKRFVKQIIRKHLVSQGMTTEGARVQICNAHT